jgi:hypothetical protein
MKNVCRILKKALNSCSLAYIEGKSLQWFHLSLAFPAWRALPLMRVRKPAPNSHILTLTIGNNERVVSDRCRLRCGKSRTINCKTLRQDTQNIVTYGGVAWLTDNAKWIRTVTDLFASGEITTTQITITKNTWCTRSGVFYGVRSWCSFWSAGLCVSSGLHTGLIWSVSSVFPSDLIWSVLCFFLVCSVLSVRSFWLSLEACFSLIQEEPYVTRIQLYPRKLVP